MFVTYCTIFVTYCHSQAPKAKLGKALLSVLRRATAESLQPKGSQAKPGAFKPAMDFTFGIQEELGS